MSDASKTRVWKNKSSFAKIGWDPTYPPKAESHLRSRKENLVQPCNIGPTLYMAPGDEFFDDHGVGDLLLANPRRFVDCPSLAEIKALKVPPQYVEYEKEIPDAEKTKYFDNLAPIGFYGPHYVLKDITEEWRAASDAVGGRVAAASSLAELKDTAMKATKKAEDTEAENLNLKAQIEALKKQMEESTARGTGGGRGRLSGG